MTTRSNSWTKEESAILRREFSGKSCAELAQILKRSACAIKSRAGVMGLKRGTEGMEASR